MSAEFWDAYRTAASTPPGPERDAAMERADAERDAAAAAEEEH